MTKTVLISEGALDTLPQSSEDFRILRGYFTAHEELAATDEPAKGVRQRRQGAFVSDHHGLRIREEFGYRGHVLYLMTSMEHASDEATWADFDFSGVVYGTGD